MGKKQKLRYIFKIAFGISLVPPIQSEIVVQITMESKMGEKNV